MNKKNSSPKQVSDKREEKGKTYDMNEYKLIRMDVCSVFVIQSTSFDTANIDRIVKVLIKKTNEPSEQNK